MHQRPMALHSGASETRSDVQIPGVELEDTPDPLWDMVRDPNARISVVTGAWAVGLSRSAAPFETIRATAARLQQAEA